ncbi:hypothetical protein HA402_010459 [Bradysia odoriphaga]|nr:hypothetical protein HA402_010459 [Bradysia odoriphaga]
MQNTLRELSHQIEGNIPGSPIQSLSPRLASARAEATCTNVYGPICGDCNTLWTCLGQSEAYRTQNCDKNYPGQPYCVDGACNGTPDPNNDECTTTTGITCTGTGYFPNPLNCSQYFFCQKPQGSSMPYECPSGFAYNSQTKQCKRRILPADCSTINCASNPDRYVAYGPDPSYYALCLVTDGVIAPIMFKCPTAEQFVQSQRRCVFQCKQEGRVVDAKDCTKYYECYRSGLNFITLHQKCLTGFIFSSEVNGCVEGTCPEGTGGTGGTGAGGSEGGSGTG